jgi:uncharacterized repeat protein (TIGR03847 family)
MSESYEMSDPDVFTTGTVGEPGHRVFYLQARTGAQVVSLRLEKAQVNALAEYLAELLSDLPTPPHEEIPDQSTLVLVEPVIAEWIVGQIGVVFDETRDRMLIRADEVVTVDEEGEALPDVVEGGVARFSLTRAQVAAFILRAVTLVEAGRPPCPLCGRPLDPEGHMCIKTNGHKTS